MRWAPLGRYMENSLKEQEKLGIKLIKIVDCRRFRCLADKSKLSDQEIGANAADV